MIKTILFDLDGTLLPMDLKTFIDGYFDMLVKYVSAKGFEPKKLVDCLWQGISVMIQNDGNQTNESAFIKKFQETYGKQTDILLSYFNMFYRDYYNEAKKFCGYNPLASKTIKLCREKGFGVVLATNPLFPSIATETRMKWAGVFPDDFDYYTTFENSSFCKPNPMYYSEILNKLSLKPEECLMVGNDATEDAAAEQVGIKVYLITDCLINKQNIDISDRLHGNFEQLYKFIKQL